MIDRVFVEKAAAAYAACFPGVPADQVVVLCSQSTVKTVREGLLDARFRYLSLSPHPDNTLTITSAKGVLLYVHDEQ